MEKKNWVKPQLVVLAKTRPEEAEMVMIACKGSSSSNSHNSQYNHCGQYGGCSACSTIAAS